MYLLSLYKNESKDFEMIEQNISVGDKIAGFTVESVTPISELNTVAYQFIHDVTGARAIHLYNDDRNNLFSTAFRTPVSDNTGVPHILEHSVLAGSEKYPLKDPFKELLKSSMQTFLNAITYPDRTLYPVSSQVEADFFNLMVIYCDAVFNPLLTENTFHQEGWHFDVEDVNEPVSIKGIVYNEMKGVFSDFQSHVARKMLSGLFPDTTYFFESGGEPEAIPELTYEAFKEFHAKFYHPSNSFIILYGDIPSEKTLGYMQDNFLKSFERREVDSAVAGQPKWDAPREMEIEAPAPKENDGTATILLNWMWPGTTDGEEGLLCDIITRYLFNGESAPLKRALLDSGLGEDLDDMCGYDNDLANGFFSAGLSKTKVEHKEAIEQLIVDTLAKEIENGFDDELLEGAIRRIEFRLREIRKGGHFPYPLRLAEGIYRSWLYSGDPLTHIAFEKNLNMLKAKKAENSGYFEKKLKEYTLDNAHRLTMIVKASSQLGEDLGKMTETQSAELSKDFTPEQISAYQKDTMTLLANQKKEHTEEELACIPLLEKEDIPLKNEVINFSETKLADATVYSQDLFTAGIVYFDISFALTCLSEEQLSYYPLYAEYLTRGGAGGFNAQEMAKRVNLHTGGVNGSDYIMEMFGDIDSIRAGSTIHLKALESTSDEMFSIVNDMLLRPDFSDKALLKNILLENRNDLFSSIARAGHSFGILNGTSRLLTTRAIEEKIDGISQYRFLKELSEDPDYDAIFEICIGIHNTLVNRETATVSITASEPKRFFDATEKLLKDLPAFIPLDNDFTPAPTLGKPLAVEISSSVNYVTQSWKLENLDSQSIGEHYLMGRILSTGYLWDKVRVEGGAYGGMAVAGSAHPTFSFASYRDPNLVSTLEHYKGALNYLINDLTEEELSRSITGTIGKLDVPKSPHTKGFGETMARIVNNLPEDRQKVREAILNCTIENIRARATFLLDHFDESEVTVLASGSGITDAVEGKQFDPMHETL